MTAIIALDAVGGGSWKVGAGTGMTTQVLGVHHRIKQGADKILHPAWIKVSPVRFLDTVAIDNEGLPELGVSTLRKYFAGSARKTSIRP